MRVPVYDEQRVTTRPLAAPAIQPASIGPALQQLGGAVQSSALQAQRLYQAESQRADAARAAQLETDFVTGANGVVDAVAAKRGEEAFAAEQEGLAKLDKLRQELIGRAGSDRQAAIAATRIDALAQDARRRLDRHITRQREVALEDIVRAREAAALDALAQGYADPESRARQMAAAESVAGALAPSAEGRARAVAEFRQKAHATVLQGYLGAMDAQGAREYLAQVRGELGAAAPQLERQIQAVARATEAERTAMQISGAAAQPATGWLDEAKALAAVDQLEPGPLKDEVRQRVQHRLAVGEQLKAKQIDERFKAAYSAYLQGGYGAIPSSLKDWLLQHAPEKLDRLRGDAERRFRQGKSDRAEARRLQAEANRLAWLDFMARPAEERAALDVDATYGGSGPNQVGMGALRVEQRRAADAVKKGLAMGEAEFIRQAKAAAVGLVKDKKAMAEYEAEMRQQWGEEKEPPNPARAREMISSALATKVRERTFLWDTEELGFEARRRQRQEGAAVLEGDDLLEAAPLPVQTPAPAEPPLDERIRAALRRRGVPNPTDEQVAAMRSRLEGRR